MPDPAAPQQGEISSREDALLERALEGLERAVAALSISLKTHLRSPDNSVFRSSLEQQHAGLITDLGALFQLVSLPYDEESVKLIAQALDTLEAPCGRIAWLDHSEAVKRLFAEAVETAYTPMRLNREGRPLEAFAALLATRVEVPPVNAPAPEQAEREVTTSAPAGSTAPAAADAAPPPRQVLFEHVFTYGDPAQPHHAHVGDMYLGFAQHGRGLSPEDARKSLTPAAVVGFAQSIEKALAGYHGVVAFRVVRDGERVGLELRRLSASAPT